MRILWVYSGRKQKSTGFLYLKGSPYHDAEGSSKLRLCLDYEIINAAPIIGGYWQKLILQIVPPQEGEGHKHDRVGKMRMCIICNDHYTYNGNVETKNGCYGDSPGN